MDELMKVLAAGWKYVVIASGALASYYTGGVPALVKLLMLAAACDYASGFVAAWLEGKLNSSVGMRGIAKKVYMFVLVALCSQLDAYLGQNHMLRDGVATFYLVNEVLSLAENGGRIGVPIPPVVLQGIEILRKKAGGASS